MEHITGASRDTSRPCTLLAVDLGNTTTRSSVIFLDEELGAWDITAPAALTADEARSHYLPRPGDAGRRAPSEAILASVVPSLTDAWRTALSRVCEGRVYVVGPGLKAGFAWYLQTRPRWAPTAWRTPWLPATPTVRPLLWWTLVPPPTSRSSMGTVPLRAA